MIILFRQEAQESLQVLTHCECPPWTIYFWINIRLPPVQQYNPHIKQSNFQQSIFSIKNNFRSIELLKIVINLDFKKGQC